MGWLALLVVKALSGATGTGECQVHPYFFVTPYNLIL